MTFWKATSEYLQYFINIVSLEIIFYRSIEFDTNKLISNYGNINMVNL